MGPKEQSALEALARRALSADEVVTLGPLVATRNDVAIAAVLSVGRTALALREITARGVRAALPIVDAVRLLHLLQETAELGSVPTWLTDVLTARGVPATEHFAYLDTLACAHGWLQQETGIDLGSPTTRAMLDLIAESDQLTFDQTVDTLKALAERPDPIYFDQVSAALNTAQGFMTL